MAKKPYVQSDIFEQLDRVDKADKTNANNNKVIFVRFMHKTFKNDHRGITESGLAEMDQESLEKLKTDTYLHFKHPQTKRKITIKFKPEFDLNDKVNAIYAVGLSYLQSNAYNYYVSYYKYLYKKRPRNFHKCRNCKNWLWRKDPRKAKKEEGNKTKLQKCSCSHGKRQYYYCNRKCQKIHWRKKHRDKCSKKKTK